MSRLGVAPLGAAAWFILGSCAGQDLDPAPSMILPAPTATWLVALVNDSMRVTVDTTGWKATAPRTARWISVSDVSTAAKRQSGSPFDRFETRQELSCAQRLARGLDIRTPDSSGAVFISPVRDSSWQPFATGRLGAPILQAVCARLATIRP